MGFNEPISHILSKLNLIEMSLIAVKGFYVWFLNNIIICCISGFLKITCILFGVFLSKYGLLKCVNKATVPSEGCYLLRRKWAFRMLLDDRVKE